MTALVILSGALGLALGSFLNVLIVRLPAGESLLRPGSRCPSCGSPVRWIHNVPVASWLALRGRCASCHARIGWQYPVVELATAVTEFRTRLVAADATAAETLIAGGFEDAERRAAYDRDVLAASQALTEAALVATEADAEHVP